MTSPASDLSHDDATAVLKATSQLWPPGTNFRQRLAGVLREITGATVVTINSFEIGTGQRQLLVEPQEWQTAVHEQRKVANGILSQHPVARRMLETGSTAVMRLSDHVNLDDWTDSQIYRDYYGPLGLTWEVTLPVPTDGGRVNIITVNSTRDLSDPARDFTDRDLAVCAALVPIAALGLGGLPEGTADPWTGMAAGWCLVRFDVKREVTHVSPADSESVLVPGLILPAFDERPTAGGSRWQVQLTDGTWIAQPVGGSRDEQIVALRRQSSSPPDLSMLTQRQHQVLELIARGHTNGRIGSELGIAEGTVRKHIETIFGLLSVSNRAAATAMWFAHSAKLPLHR